MCLILKPILIHLRSNLEAKNIVNLNWDIITKLSPLEIQIHWITVTIAFVLGIIIFSMKKGTLFHKTLGWGYVILMLITSAAAFFIRNVPENESAGLVTGFSWIHLFIPLTVFGLSGALIAIRKGNVRNHRSAMISTFVGAILIAGFFTFLPGRRMHAFFFADPTAVEKAVDRLKNEE